MRYSVTAVVVSYNREELLAECLAGIDRQTRQPDHLIVIDNASTDGALGVARRFAARTAIPTRVVTLPRNVGGAGGFTAGIALAVEPLMQPLGPHESGAGYRMGGYEPQPGLVHDVWLMDDDTVPLPNALEELLRASDACVAQNGRVPVALGSKAVWTDGREHLMNKPRPRTHPAKGGAKLRGFPSAYQTRSLSFVSCLLNADTIAAMRRLPKTAYFLWNDDYEYTTALLKRHIGYYVPASEVVHKTKVFGSSDADPGARFYNEVRNKIWLWRGSRGNFTRTERVLFLLKTVRRWALTWLHSPDRTVIADCLRRGWHDGWHTTPEHNTRIDFGDAAVNRAVRACEGAPTDD
ncbi:glycosyltransferase [Bifidobacterium pseudolongum]|uniref:glycosyltransferase n=1 Tax=Bifidobacterium pseudolongum TaxID=1694 RepID=UPI0010202524|nr:glycosyltransferase [Bifidobacterium pseudolongum]RYQ66025.1 glycosyl transferase family 2 [Bifidobacterium pseudolongum subsp. globosum]